jgi:putative hydrolase of the HAD superfamily
MIQAILFDLDDTLYPERDFSASGYTAVARKVAEEGGCDFATALDQMAYSLRTAGKKAVFPDLLAYHPEIPLTIGDLVRVYREHAPAITLPNGYRQLLQQLRENYRLGIITDGLPPVQRGKVRALGIDGLFDKIIYSWDYGEERQKPHAHSFNLMTEFFRIPPESVLFVGDNPEKDGRGARDAGMRFVRVMSPQGAEGVKYVKGGKDVKGVIGNLLQLPQVLRNEN